MTVPETPEAHAMWRATVLARRLIAESKNPRTTMGRKSATGVAYIVVHDAIREYQRAMEEQ